MSKHVVNEEDANTVVAALLSQVGFDPVEDAGAIENVILRCQPPEYEYFEDKGIGTFWEIIWEEGPYAWPMCFPYGGMDEEFGRERKDVSGDIPDHLFVEAINHYSVGVYRKATPYEPWGT
jgi:hypothetical protein